MTRKNEPREESYALGGSRNRIRRINVGEGRFYLDGDVVTPWGIVSVTTQSIPYARYDFAIGGRHYMRTEYRARTERGLTIEATKFARRIASGASLDA